MRAIRFALLLSLSSVACSGPAGVESISQSEHGLKSACPPDQTVLGIDIAKYQHPNGAAIDWPTVAGSRRFVIVKASGAIADVFYTNPYYEDDSQQARANGMVVGAYHYLRYSASGAEQASHFLSSIGGSVPDGDLPPMLDVEDTTDEIAPSERVVIVKEWLDTVEQATGRKPMIYSGAWYWGPYLGTPVGFSEHPLVWASYTTSCPNIPDDFPGLTMWQYLGGEGSTPGISAPCDQDRFYGSESDLLRLAAAKPAFAGESLGSDGQSFPIVAAGSVKVQLGSTVSGWVKLKNVGAQSWQPGTVWLAPIPRDQASPFASPSWKSDRRMSTVSSEVKPGEVGQFALDITGSELGQSVLSLGWVADGSTWFADDGGPEDGYFAVKVNVVEAASPSSGGSGGVEADGGSVQHAASAEDGASCAMAPASRGSGGALWISALFLTVLGWAYGMRSVTRR